MCITITFIIAEIIKDILCFRNFYRACVITFVHSKLGQVVVFDSLKYKYSVFIQIALENKLDIIIRIFVDFRLKLNIRSKERGGIVNIQE